MRCPAPRGTTCPTPGPTIPAAFPRMSELSMPASSPTARPPHVCDEYRAAATLDPQHDAADHDTHRITCPTPALWSATGATNAWYDPDRSGAPGPPRTTSWPLPSPMPLPSREIPRPRARNSRPGGGVSRSGTRLRRGRSHSRGARPSDEARLRDVGDKESLAAHGSEMDVLLGYLSEDARSKRPPDGGERRTGPHVR